jgi:Na+-driven multidrug efflux pump
MQAGFMPAVALSFALAAVVGQNYGAGQSARVREAFLEGVKLNVGFMLVFTVISQLCGGWLVARFSSETAVVSVGAEYLHLVAFNYVSSGLIMVAAGVFQGLGNTLPSLLASASRLITFFVPVFWLARQPHFSLQQVWLTSMASVNLQMVLVMLLLRRELGRRLPSPAAAVPVAAS